VGGPEGQDPPHQVQRRPNRLPTLVTPGMLLVFAVIPLPLLVSLAAFPWRAVLFFPFLVWWELLLLTFRLIPFSSGLHFDSNVRMHICFKGQFISHVLRFHALLGLLVGLRWLLVGQQPLSRGEKSSKLSEVFS